MIENVHLTRLLDAHGADALQENCDGRKALDVVKEDMVPELVEFYTEHPKYSWYLLGKPKPTELEPPQIR